MLRIKVDNWKFRVNSLKKLGQGGEAEIYKLREDVVAKVFLEPDDLQFRDQSGLQKAAEVRIEEMQEKIFNFPKGLPAGFVVPNGALIDKKKIVFGYVMPYIKGTGLEKLTQTDAKLSAEQISSILVSLYNLVTEVHSKGVVIGDFNENNIIVDKDFVSHIIDTDSSQFGPYLCRNFMPHFVAPELVVGERLENESGGTRRSSKKDPPLLTLLTPHTELTDWYSFLVIAMRLVTWTGPYGGVLDDLDLRERFIERATVFDRRVTYPANARPLNEVPRPLLETFFRFFSKGERFVPNLESVESVKTLKTGRAKRQR